MLSCIAPVHYRIFIWLFRLTSGSIFTKIYARILGWLQVILEWKTITKEKKRTFLFSRTLDLTKPDKHSLSIEPSTWSNRGDISDVWERESDPPEDSNLILEYNVPCHIPSQSNCEGEDGNGTTCLRADLDATIFPYYCSMRLAHVMSTRQIVPSKSDVQHLHDSGTQHEEWVLVVGYKRWPQSKC